MSDPSPRVPWFREPLVHFLLLGGALFAVSRVVPSAEESVERRIVLDEAARQELVDRFVQEQGEAPSDAQMEELLAQWVYSEILYREGIALGLDREDPQIRGRVIQKMAKVQGDLAAVGDPDEAQLRAFFDVHRGRYDDPLRVDLTHVFVEGTGPEEKVEAARLEVLVEGGASPRGLGDRFRGGRKLRRRSIESITGIFGDEFAVGLETLSTGEWHLRRSDHGWHVVKLDRVYPARPAEFEALEVELADAWRAEQRQRATRAELEELAKKYEIVGVEGFD